VPPDDFDEDERPTSSDLVTFPCADCGGEGEVLAVRVDEACAHRHVRATCPTCKGLKRIDRETMERWKRRQVI